MKVPFTVYMVQCENRRTGRMELYVGLAKNIFKRYQECLLLKRYKHMKKWHRNDRRKLVYVEIVKNGFEAAKRERQIKHMSVARKLQLINSDLNILDHVDPNFGRPIFYWKDGVNLPNNPFISTGRGESAKLTQKGMRTEAKI